MNELFGISMSTIMVALAAMLALCLLSVAWVWARRRVVFNLGARNIPRRKAQTALIVFGLMLSTLIVTAALGTGDTVSHSMTAEVYGQLGQIDQFVADPEEADIYGTSFASTIPASSWTTLQNTLTDAQGIDGASPMLERRISVRSGQSGVGVPDMVAVGLDPATIGALGGLQSLNGDPIDLATLPAGSVVLSEMAAKALDAASGDTLTLFLNDKEQTVTVAAVAEDAYLSGVRRDGDTEKEVAGMAMTLPALQSFAGMSDRISVIALSNEGGVRDGVDQSAAVQSSIEPAVQRAGLVIDPLKQSWLDDATMMANVFTGLFLVVGLFSISAGILLILLIFTMLAAERRSEMGMARAVGAHRSQLVQQFMSEGAIYALLAGLVGSALGVAVAYGIALGTGSVFSDYVNIEPSISARSVAAAYCLGVVITFIAVVGSSWRISRLNIVAAVRDLPDNSQRQRSIRTLIWQGLLLVGGVLLTMQGISSGKAFAFMGGVSLLVLASALILRQLGLSSRLVFTTAGLLLLGFWLMPDDLFTRIFGEYDGDFEMFFVSGIFLVISATLVIMQNDRMLLGLVSRSGSIFRSRVAALKLGVAYPGAARSRTGMTIAMFSLIVFSLVMIATINLNFEKAFLSDNASAGWDIDAQTGSGLAVPGMQQKLTQGGIDAGTIAAIGTLTEAQHSAASQPGANDWFELSFAGMNDAFIDSTIWTFSNRAEGYTTDAQILQALRTQPNVAVVDTFTIDGSDDSEAQQLFASIDLAETTFAPVQIAVRDGANAASTVTVIGVISPALSTFDGLYTGEMTAKPILGDDASTTYTVQLANSDEATAVAREMQSILLPYGVQATSIEEELRDNQQENRGFFTILQAFMGLGLVVGIAAIGVISSRNVIERRQQIGVLRAIGYQRGMVSLSFMIEAAFIVGLGVVSGTALGLGLAHNLLTGGAIAEAGDISFVVPWNTVGIVLGLAVVAALVTTWLPARQAAGISPAEALRYE